MAGDIIQADYEVLEQVANRFTQQGDQIQQMIQLVRNRMDPLQGGGWIGKGSERFFAEMEGEIQPACERLRIALEEGGTLTRQIVQALSSSEEQAASGFQVTGS